MVDLFTQSDVQKLLGNRLIWIFGDSNVRALYKDLVWLVQRNDLIPKHALKSKLERSFMNDIMTTRGDLCRGRNFQEERTYINDSLGIGIEFMFLTRCLNERLERKFRSIEKNFDSPDVVIFNSCLWDICRWGPDGVSQYKKNIGELMRLMKKCLAPTTLVLWTTTPPVASHIKGGFLIKQIEFMQESARFEVMEGNLFVRQEVLAHGFDVLDLHYYLVLQMHRRNTDGVHWPPQTVRFITNLVLTHIALSWGHPLPGNFKSELLARTEAEPMLYQKQQEAAAEVASTLRRLENLTALQQHTKNQLTQRLGPIPTLLPEKTDTRIGTFDQQKPLRTLERLGPLPDFLQEKDDTRDQQEPSRFRRTTERLGPTPNGTIFNQGQQRQGDFLLRLGPLPTLQQKVNGHSLSGAQHYQRVQEACNLTNSLNYLNATAGLELSCQSSTGLQQPPQDVRIVRKNKGRRRRDRGNRGNNRNNNRQEGNNRNNNHQEGNNRNNNLQEGNNRNNNHQEGNNRNNNRQEGNNRNNNHQEGNNRNNNRQEGNNRNNNCQEGDNRNNSRQEGNNRNNIRQEGNNWSGSYNRRNYYDPY